MKVSCVILDLDNTLYDWFHMWYSSFRPFLDEVVSISKIDENKLKNEFRKIHQKHGTSEYPFRLEQSELLAAHFPESSLKEKFSSAVYKERDGRNSSLELYPGVLETLWKIKRSGCKIVAYTDSMGIYTIMRLKRLGLDGLIDVVYTTQDHDLPEGVNLDEYRSNPSEFYKLNVTDHRYVPAGEVKPNPEVLLDIIKDLNILKKECVYIGDSLDRDIAMANDAGVFSVWAEYGKKIDADEYQLLKDVTHWPVQSVDRESKADSKKSIVPSETIASFDELLNIFDFTKYNYDGDISHIIDVWKKVVDVQQHFNDIEMKIRNLFVIILASLIGLYGYFIRSSDTSVFLDFMFAIVICSITFLFYFMDLHWYHRLLNASVADGIEIEKKLSDRMPYLKLGTDIKSRSPIDAPNFIRRISKWPFLNKLFCFLISDARFHESGKIHSDAKIEIFYKSVIVGIITLFAFSCVVFAFSCVVAFIQSIA